MPVINRGKVKNMRLLGITIPDNKRLEIGLTAIYGIGRPRALKILKEAGIDAGLKAKDVSTDQENSLRKIIESYRLEGDLRREISGNIKRLKDIKTYKGGRHGKQVPVRGQRTKTNSRTRRGNVRKTMGTGRRAVEKK
jgi:small subunit ribosomal protein S13